MKREAIRVLIIDGQGGGMGRGLVEAVKKRWPALHLRAVGTNSMATAAMLRAGADEGATGENAVIFNAKWAHVMMGPIGVLTPNGLLGEVSAAMAADTSPSNPLGVSTPMGPIITCAHLALKITAFSPVAPSSAPARSMAAVAMELVPTARRCSAGQRFFTASTSPRPIPPPCPSMISTRIASRFIRFVPPVVHGSIDVFHYTGSLPPASTAERHRRSLFSGAGLRTDRKSGKFFSKA